MAKSKERRVYRRSKTKNTRHRAGPRRISILEAAGAAIGAARFGGSGDSAINTLDNLKNFQSGGLENIASNMGANVNMASAVKVAEPIIAGFVAEWVAKKLHLNHKIGKRWKI